MGLRSASDLRGRPKTSKAASHRSGSAKGSPLGDIHVAFVAPSRASVDVFYRAALDSGGKDNGRPGLRPHYHANYYAAFVLDLDGNNIEAVCHAPETSAQAAKR